MKRIWLTGASSGLGAELARELLRGGHRVAVSARNRSALQTLANIWGAQVLVLPGDLRDAAQVRQIGQQIEHAWGGLDQVVLNAGTCEYIDSEQFDAGVIERLVASNLLATSHCIEVALPLLRRGQQPHLVGVASSVTLLPLPRAGAYGASKAALRYLLESLRIDLAREGIDVTLVSPGFVDTPLTRQNDFPMPMCWPAAKAAQHIATRLDRRPYEIAFPAPFIFGLRLAALLPKRVQLMLAKRMSRPLREAPQR
ncbi:SDR family NAD(P)-dependent oxidoreductase [Pseudomonas fontis]|uniref:SDR family NAD(P)-dependent oxidoreductase n=1 Tax=Pseudomonas fontis TaxID=2942633 RepID=A0ABT5NY74_9PSED|nr:SDR family NAD(P)-dependent oxidoreductase [Pseudomonas fontis]MDD0977484.1 SDR family NAD(P)-dependent oxidoreductase [Pseudomonas fontis]MDD0993092.1 SDR family NAD(P)-dependent oxidoreductase [Pseudomonas fontis]